MRVRILPLLLLLAAPLAAQQRDDSFAWQRQLASGRTLDVRGVNGTLTVRPASGQQATVRARKQARTSPLASVEIRVIESDRGAIICAVYPSSRGGECGSKGERRQDEENDVVVDFEVEVPAGVAFEGSTVNGNIDAQGLRSDAEVSTVNGSIDLSTTGAAEASSVNGNVTLRFGRSTWSGTLEAETVNGRVVVELPAEGDLEFSASTVNGEITSDFPITVQGRMSPRELKGTIGKGGRKLELETVNGDIKLTKAG
ncbi:MAG: DUF4097 domain-containing protein [Gemmatimonadales bacterium]|nr:DUF4097 domain-containing protein [Gemmatimonadales bacterium]